PPAGAPPPIRARDEHRGDRRDPRPFRGRRPGADPPRPPGRRRRARPRPGARVTPGGLPDRGGADLEAPGADRYLDALLAAAERHAGTAAADAMLDPELQRAAGVLRRSLVRVHPSFRFEERLADRLAALARADAATRDEAATGTADAPSPAGRL